MPVTSAPEIIKLRTASEYIFCCPRARGDAWRMMHTRLLHERAPIQGLAAVLDNGPAGDPANTSCTGRALSRVLDLPESQQDPQLELREFRKGLLAATPPVSPNPDKKHAQLTPVGPGHVSVDGLRIEGTSVFGSCKAELTISRGRVQYEVELATSGIMQLGWMPPHCQFTEMEGVGDAPCSFAYDGARLCKWNEKRKISKLALVLMHLIHPRRDHPTSYTCATKI